MDTDETVDVDTGEETIRDIQERMRLVDAPRPMSRYFPEPPVIRPVGYRYGTRMEMIFLIATGEYSYRQIGARYGRNENAMRQFAFDNKVAINQERARLRARQAVAFDGRLAYRDRVLKQIIDEADGVLAELKDAAEKMDLRFLAGQSAFVNFHQVWCRYRELQADVVQKLMAEPNPRRRAVAEEAEVDGDRLFDAVCPQCRDEEPSGEPDLVRGAAHAPPVTSYGEPATPVSCSCAELHGPRECRSDGVDRRGRPS